MNYGYICRGLQSDPDTTQGGNVIVDDAYFSRGGFDAFNVTSC